MSKPTKHIVESLKLDCRSDDPHVALRAMRLIETGRDWIADCEWQDLEPEDIESLGTAEIVQGINYHYDGGWYAFVRAGQ